MAGLDWTIRADDPEQSYQQRRDGTGGCKRFLNLNAAFTRVDAS